MPGGAAKPSFRVRSDGQLWYEQPDGVPGWGSLPNHTLLLLLLQRMILYEACDSYRPQRQHFSKFLNKNMLERLTVGD